MSGGSSACQMPVIASSYLVLRVLCNRASHDRMPQSVLLCSSTARVWLPALYVTSSGQARLSTRLSKGSCHARGPFHLSVASAAPCSGNACGTNLRNGCEAHGGGAAAARDRTQGLAEG